MCVCVRGERERVLSDPQCVSMEERTRERGGCVRRPLIFFSESGGRERGRGREGRKKKRMREG